MRLPAMPDHTRNPLPALEPVARDVRVFAVLCASARRHNERLMGEATSRHRDATLCNAALVG